jgi:hypothetical protein
MAQISRQPGSIDPPAIRFDRTYRSALDLLRQASEEWAKGNSEEPPTELILEETLRMFEKERFLKRGGYARGFPKYKPTFSGS